MVRVLVWNPYALGNVALDKLVGPGCRRCLVLACMRKNLGCIKIKNYVMIMEPVLLLCMSDGMA